MGRKASTPFCFLAFLLQKSEFTDVSFITGKDIVFILKHCRYVNTHNSATSHVTLPNFRLETFLHLVYTHTKFEAKHIAGSSWCTKPN